MVSVIATCRNEAEKIQPFIDAWLHKVDEIIVLDQDSEDTSASLLMKASIRYKHFFTFHVEKDVGFEVARRLAGNVEVLFVSLDERPEAVCALA